MNYAEHRPYPLTHPSSNGAFLSHRSFSEAYGEGDSGGTSFYTFTKVPVYEKRRRWRRWASEQPNPRLKACCKLLGKTPAFIPYTSATQVFEAGVVMPVAGVVQEVVQSKSAE